MSTEDKACSVKTRNSYTSKRKLEVVQYAEVNGNRAAARQFQVSECSVRLWRKQKPVLSVMKPTKRARRSGKCHWPELENEVEKWILGLRSEGRRVSTTIIRYHAKSLAASMGITSFSGSSMWCNRFMHRNSLSLRATTSVGQRLPPNWEEKVAEFGVYLNEQKTGVNTEQIVNMDEVPMTFDLPSNFTVEKKGSQTVKINTCGAEKCSFTLVLAVTATGKKLKPMVIFKRLTIPKDVTTKDIFVQANEKGWMDNAMFKTWIDEIFRKRPGAFFAKRSVLILASAPAHISHDSKIMLNKVTSPVVIPGGLTCKLQPLDISVNKSFKSKVRDKWESWMISGYHTFTKSGKMRRASYGTVCEWIADAWKSVSETCIINGFQKANIIAKTNEGTVDVSPFDESTDEETQETGTNESAFNESTDEDTDFEDSVPPELIELLDSLNIDFSNEEDDVSRT